MTRRTPRAHRPTQTHPPHADISTSRPSTPGLHVTATAADAMQAAARAARPLETGGILLGWHERPRIHVQHALEVPSRDATASGYVLDAHHANHLISHAQHHTRDPHLGYVGSWHSHPTLLGPSPTDHATFTRTARNHPTTIAFIVVATHGPATLWFTTVLPPPRP